MNSSQPRHLSVYFSKDIRAIENAVNAQSPNTSLMQRAGLAAANFVRQLVALDASVLIFAGPGDNGGDAFEMAAHLSRQGNAVHIYCIGEEQQYSSDATQSLNKAKRCAIRWITQHQELELALDSASIIVDGLFGIGLNRAITGHRAELIGLINQTAARKAIPVLALDIPSGLNADTGQIHHGEGANKNTVDNTNATRSLNAIIATHTLTFIGYKPGLFTAKGKDYSGKVTLANLDIEPQDFPATSVFLNAKANLETVLQPRPHDSNKGSFGDISIIGGANGMCGAAILSARGALLSGAGKVHIGFCSELPQAAIAFDPQYPEIMCRHASQIDFSKGVIAIGPGLSLSTMAKELLESVLKESPQVVIDADAINLIAQHPLLQQQVSQRHLKNFNTILTPHPLEAARLLNTDVASVQANRLEAITALSNKFQAIVILKGSGSLISDGQTTYINTSGNPALATGGTGDVLTGVCAALLAQGLTALNAARLACYVHGAAADNLVEAGIGPIGLNASELVPAIRRQLILLSKVVPRQI